MAGEEFTGPVLIKLVMLHDPSVKLFAIYLICAIIAADEVITIKVLIDADGCPVTAHTLRLCKKYHIPCLILCDTAHEFYQDGTETLVFDKGADSVDYALVNRVNKNDIVVTQDYGLASMCLSRECRVLHQDGWEYTQDNIDALLLVRHESRKHRASCIRFKGPKKRTEQQNQIFSDALERLLQNEVQG